MVRAATRDSDLGGRPQTLQWMETLAQRLEAIEQTPPKDVSTLREFQRLSERVELLEKNLPPKATPTESINVSVFNARVYGLERKLGSLKNAVGILCGEARLQKAR